MRCRRRAVWDTLVRVGTRWYNWVQLDELVKFDAGLMNNRTT